MSERASELRRAFDASFQARPVVSEASVELLTLSVADERLALRVSEIVSVHRVERIQRLPGSTPELLGLAGIRGRAVAVYDLAALLGRGRAPSVRWLVLTGSPVVGLAFAEIGRQERVLASSVTAAKSTERFVRAIAALPGELRAVLDLPALWQEVARRAPADGGP